MTHEEGHKREESYYDERTIYTGPNSCENAMAVTRGKWDDSDSDDE